MAALGNQQLIIRQLDSVLALYRRVELDNEWRTVQTRSLAVIEQAAPAGSAYAIAVKEIFAEDAAPTWNVEQLIGVVQALREDYVGGFMQRVEELVHASVFDDFLEMAGELLIKGYKGPAAVLGGSVLEEHLRKLAGRANSATTGTDGTPYKTDRINADLAKASVYNVLEQKGVTAWLDLRNKAAHGHYDEFDAGHVDLMIQGVRGFVARYPA